jgi:hypothetical protein
VVETVDSARVVWAIVVGVAATMLGVAVEWGITVWVTAMAVAGAGAAAAAEEVETVTRSRV